MFDSFLTGDRCFCWGDDMSTPWCLLWFRHSWCVLFFPRCFSTFVEAFSFAFAYLRTALRTYVPTVRYYINLSLHSVSHIFSIFCYLCWIQTDFALRLAMHVLCFCGFVLFTFRRKSVLVIGVWMREWGVWMHMGVYECVTDAYEGMRMHMNAYVYIK